MTKSAREVIAEYFYDFPPCAPTRGDAEERAALVEDYLRANNFVILPKEPSEKMYMAGANVVAKSKVTDDPRGVATDSYRAMTKAYEEEMK